VLAGSPLGRRTALELARHGTVVLVGRDPNKLRDLEADMNALTDAHALSVVGDFSDVTSPT
jgi:NAD(P)-dependent dehydrogenase (short-subunit alcohol dehydrogenase family)